MSAIGIGTWNIYNYKNAEEALINAIEIGVNVLETAAFYADGLAEELIGRVVARVGRERLFIVTKLLPYSLANEDSAIKAVQASLRRLRTNYVDLLLVYGIHEILPIQHQIRILEMLAEMGYTRYIGVGSYRVKDLKEAIESVRKYSIVVNQVVYNVFNKRIERDMLPFSIKNNILVQACRPLDGGSVVRHPLLIKIANNYKKTPAQIALNFLISRPNVAAIVKSEQKNHVLEIGGAMGWRLNISDIELLESL
ncbi:MAG: aldo/keto reductase [Ignisphaera sp.]|nr:aldo/keto reductase [Ignisphaera sp.]